MTLNGTILPLLQHNISILYFDRSYPPQWADSFCFVPQWAFLCLNGLFCVLMGFNKPGQVVYGC